MLATIKLHVEHNQHISAMAVNSRLLYTYWIIGLHILQQQKEQGWGAKVIDQLAKDLSIHFAEMKGFSTRNLKYMRKFASEWNPNLIVQQGAAQLPKTKKSAASCCTN